MKRLFHPLALPPDLVTALRAAFAFSVALVICSVLGVPLAGQFAATTAMGVSLPQLRGAYHIRVMVLLVMIAVISCAAGLGGLVAGNLWAAMAGIGVLALLSGLWRHLSSDYGMPLAVDSALLYLLALEGPSRGATPLQMATWTALGGLGAGVLHLAIWLVRPQHALRNGVAECWVAAADVFLAMRPGVGDPTAEKVAQKQRVLRETLDRASKTLALPSIKAPVLLRHLDHMRHEAAHFAMKVTAFHTSSDSLRGEAACALHVTTLDSLLLEIANLSRSVAITLITHRPENLGITEVRLQTCQRMILVLDEQLDGAVMDAGSLTQMRGLLDAMAAELTEIGNGLSQTVDPSVRQKRVPFRLPDLSGKPIQSLSAWLNPAPSVDPGLVRYAMRMAVLCMIAVGLYKFFHIPRGYWMPFAIIVVLQPDYGSTRKRAGQRMGGTFAGVVLGSLLLLCSMPMWLLGTLTTVTAFWFAYFVKSRYGVAIFFVTVMLVLVTELHAPVHLDFTIGRLLSNLGGSVMALMAALYFWPSWEREKFPSLLGKAIRANDAYLAAVSQQLSSGGAFAGVVPAKQKAERSGHTAAASLQRMLTEPQRHREDAARGLAAVTCNERITRAISVLATHLATGAQCQGAHLTEAVAAIRLALEGTADLVENGVPITRQANRGVRELAPPTKPSTLSYSLDELAGEVQGLLLAFK